MKAYSLFAIAAGLMVTAQVAPALADCRDDVMRLSRAGILVDPRAIEEYRAAQEAMSRRDEGECQGHLDRAISYQRSSGLDRHRPRYSDRSYDRQRYREDDYRRDGDGDRYDDRYRSEPRSGSSTPLDELLRSLSR